SNIRSDGERISRNDDQTRSECSHRGRSYYDLFGREWEVIGRNIVLWRACFAEVGERRWRFGYFRRKRDRHERQIVACSGGREERQEDFEEVKSGCGACSISNL